MVDRLSFRDVELLSREPTADSRAQIAAKLGPLLDEDLSATERWIAEAVARRLAEDVVELVRQALAVSVRTSHQLPKDVALSLAYDVDAVAVPFLEVTEVFSDQELGRIAKAVNHAARCAIARRSGLPAVVARDLADRGSLQVLQALVANETAKLEENVIVEMLQRIKTDASLLEQMAEAGVLPSSIARDLIVRVSARIGDSIARRFDLPEDMVRPLMDSARSEAIRRYAAVTDPDEARVLAHEMHRHGELDAFTVLNAAQFGNLAFFEASMAIRADLPLENVTLLVRHGGRNGILGLCKKAHIPNLLLEDILAAVGNALKMGGMRNYPSGGSAGPH